VPDLICYKIRKDFQPHRHETQFPIDKWSLQGRTATEHEPGTKRLVISVAAERFAISMTEEERQRLIEILSE